MVPSEKLLDHRNLRKNNWINRSGDLSHRLHAGLAFNLPLKFPKTVESDVKSEDFQFFPTVILVPTCVYVSIYTRYSSHTPPPQCPTPPPNPTCPTPPPRPPPPTRGVGGVGWGIGVVGYGKNIVNI